MTYIKQLFYFSLFGFLLACNSNSKEASTTIQTSEKEATSEGKKQFTTHNVPWSEVNSFEKIPFDFMVPYGEEDLQFGELWTPLAQDTFPLVIFIHGGCWLSAFNLDYISTVANDLVKAGYAVWTPEYRRVGDEGGGYPNTFKDIQASVNFARTLAEIYPLDIENVVVMGHSAGGHLALWLATQENLSENSRLYNDNPLPLKGVIALAGITDLVAYDKVGNDCGTVVVELMGGNPKDLESQYYNSSPINLVPANIPIRLVHGDKDNIVPLAQSESFAAKAQAAGDDVKVLTIEGGGHFDMVSPHSAAWQVIKKELAELVD